MFMTLGKEFEFYVVKSETEWFEWIIRKESYGYICYYLICLILLQIFVKLPVVDSTYETKHSAIFCHDQERNLLCVKQSVLEVLKE